MPVKTMGFDLGLSLSDTCFKRKFRWMLFIDDISGEGTYALPPLRSSRPSLSFKEMEAQHLNETIFFPSKPEWKPFTLSLYDINKKSNYVNPVIKWIKSIYDASSGSWSPNISSGSSFKKECRLEMLDGCGKTIETWIFDNAWPQNIEFGELDMSSSEVMTIDLTLRYDRAYIV